MRMFTLEERFYTKWQPLKLFNVGAAVFFDAGRTWGTDPYAVASGDGESLAAGRAVGDDSNRVDRLVGRAGGDEDVLAGEGHFAPRKPFFVRNSTMACGSGRRPGPNSPHAISPSSGSITVTPSTLS